MGVRVPRSASSRKMIAEALSRPGHPSKLVALDFEALSQMAAGWHVQRFPAASSAELGLKLAEECGEVCRAINSDLAVNSDKRDTSVVEECADVLIVMMALLGRWYPMVNLLDEVTKKLDILTDPASGHRAAARS